MNINEDYVNQKMLSSVIQGPHCFTEEEAKFFYEKITEGERQINVNNLDLNYYINIEQNLLKYINEKIPAVSRFHIPQQRILLLRRRNQYPQTT